MDDAGGGGAAAPGLRCRIGRRTRGDYYWRLTAQNGRVVAVSAEWFTEVDACRKAFGELCAQAGALSGMVVHTAHGNGWVWTARDPEGRPVAQSYRAYQRHATCRTAFDRFHAMLLDLVAAGAPDCAEP